MYPRPYLGYALKSDRQHAPERDRWTGGKQEKQESKLVCRPRVRTERVEIETERGRKPEKKKTSGRRRQAPRPTPSQPDEADTDDDHKTTAPPAAPEALTRLNGLYHPADRSTFYTSTASSAPIRRPVGYCTRRILLVR